MRAAYTGYEALTFSDYLDLETGRTLHAEPGGVYDIAPASGRAVDGIPAPWFVTAGEDGEYLPEPDVQPEPADEPQDVPEPGPEPEPAQF